MTAGTKVRAGSGVSAPGAKTPADAYREDFSRQASAPDWLSTLRTRAFAQFETLGFPTTKNEDWHFTSVSAISERPFRTATADRAQPHRIKLADLEPYTFESRWHRLVFVDGAFSEDLSSYAGLGNGARVSSLSRAIASGAGRPERQLAKIATFEQHAFTALNTAFIGDGALCELSGDAIVREPIHLMFVSTGRGGIVSHPRNLIVAAKHSRATVVESFVSLADGSYLTNSVTEIELGEGARVDHYKIQRESESAYHVGTVQVRQARNSVFNSFSFATGGALARANTYTTLNGDAATCTLDGLYLADGTQKLDQQTSIEHVAPNCPSHEVYKGVLDGSSHGVFNGKVYVHPEAQKTDGKQSNNNLLLSKTARVDTKPQLEIFADDVKCTHGATIGRLDDMAMFYLNSRGISRDRARTLLTYAFAADVLERIELEPLKLKLEELVLARFTESDAA